MNNIKFRKLHGETEWLIKPYREDGTMITDEEIDTILAQLNGEIGFIEYAPVANQAINLGVVDEPAGFPDAMAQDL